MKGDGGPCHLRQQIRPVGEAGPQVTGDGGEPGAISRDGLGICQGGEPEQIRFAGAHTGLLYPLQPAAKRLHPGRVVDHHPARARG